MTQRSGLLAVLATVLLVLSFATHVPAPPRAIPVSDDRSVPHASSRVSLGPTDPTGPISAVTVSTTVCARGRVATLVDAGHVDEAIMLLETVLAANSNDAEAHHELAQIFVTLDRSEDSIRHYEHALATAPSRSDYHVELGRALAGLGRWDRAIGEYQVAAEGAPTDVSIHYWLGRVLHESGQDEKAIEAYQTAISLDPSASSPHLSLGVSYEGLREWNDAVAAYGQYLDLAPASPTTSALKWHVVAILENQERARAGG